MGLPCLCWPPLLSSVFPGLQRGLGRAWGGSRRNQPQCCQGWGLLDHCPFFVANGDNSALTSRMGRACVPGSRGGKSHPVVTGSVRGPSRMCCLLALQGQRGSGGHRGNNKFPEERGQEKKTQKEDGGNGHLLSTC